MIVKTGGGGSMIVEKDVAIPVSDGHVLRANIYRPEGTGRQPVLMALGIYGKDAHFGDAYKALWDVLKRIHPAIDTGDSTGHWLRWENVDPELWVPHGYVVITVDARGTGMSPGYLDPLSPRETQDYYDAIEWAGVQPWSSGKVGLIGISYFAMKQWQVAALRPPHLAAMVPWEGNSDFYREWSHHGGILADSFLTAWWPRQVLPNQHGNAQTHHRDRDTDQRTTGPALSPDLLAGNRATHHEDIAAHPFDDAWFRQRSPDLSRIDVPLLSAGNWGGIGLHLRGNIVGWEQAASHQKWLSLHIGTHFESFYLPAYIEIQRRFLDKYLKEADNGWEREPRVRLEVRRADGTATTRMESEWPLARTLWTRLYLDAAARLLVSTAPKIAADASYEALGEGIDLSTPPFEEETEYTGPVAARLWIRSSTTDMDIFATLRAFDPDGVETIFIGASEPVPVTRGWLRASHRRLDRTHSETWRPWLAHADAEPLTPGETYAVDLEIWPTSVVMPKGWRLVLTLQGRDFEFPGTPGRMLHNNPVDRPPDRFGGLNTILSGGTTASYLLMPLIA